MLTQREKLVQISTVLAETYQKLTEAKIDLLASEMAAAARKLELAPAGGWPGKNEEERKLAKQQAYDNDPALTQLSNEITALQIVVLECSGKIDAQVALRRGLEYSINDLFLDMLSGQFERIILGEALKAKFEPEGATLSGAGSVGYKEAPAATVSIAAPVAPVHGSSNTPVPTYQEPKAEKPKANKEKPAEEKPKVTGKGRDEEILKELGF